ncbi:MAG: amidase family protein [Pseudomonadota bacterium]
MTREWLKMSAAELGQGIGAGQIDPVELTDAYLEAANAHPERDRIYARLTPERARIEAAGARARADLRRGPLDGVPISWKDLYDSAGTATEAGSRLLAGRVPARDARVLASATVAGLVCLGKTHTTELAFSGLGYNPVTATPPNINDPDVVPGGSSSGAAASVAFGLAAAGIGSDTGGSVRVPAAWNDLVGLKTSHGLLSAKGVVPLAPRFDTVGPLCRTVEDAGLLLEAMGGPKAPDLSNAALDRARFLVVENAIDGAEDSPVRAFEAAVGRLAAAGATVQRARLACVADALEMSAILFATEAYGTWKQKIEENPEVMFPAVRERFRGGAAFSGADYVAAWQRLDELRQTYMRETAGFDAVLVPTAPIMPPNLARLEADQDYFVERNLMTLRNTRIGNLMGLCALTLPTGTPSAGISFLAGPAEELRLLQLGAAAERALT